MRVCTCIMSKPSGNEWPGPARRPTRSLRWVISQPPPSPGLCRRAPPHCKAWCINHTVSLWCISVISHRGQGESLVPPDTRGTSLSYQCN